MIIDVNSYLSKLDCDRFGYPVAKVNDLAFPIEVYLDAFKKEGVKLVFARLSLQSFDKINELEKLGFLLKDIQITYRYMSSDTSITSHIFNPQLKLRDAAINDLEVLSVIAKESFNQYGHYFRDKNLDPNKVGEIYKDWIEKSLNDEGVADKIIVAEYNEKIAGFLSFKRYSGEKPYIAGGLGAVDNNYRNLNIFKDINAAGIKWAKEIGVDWIEHNVLVSNLPVNRVYNSLGFHVKDSFVTLHGWL